MFTRGTIGFDTLPYHWYAMAGNSHPIPEVSDIVPTRGAAQSVLLVREKEVLRGTR